MKSHAFSLWIRPQRLTVEGARVAVEIAADDRGHAARQLVNEACKMMNLSTEETEALLRMLVHEAELRDFLDWKASKVTTC